MSLPSIRDFDLKNKKVLMRVDFNVPLKDGKITNDARIKAALPSIEYILNQKCPLILMSHLGKPKGKVKSELSLKPVARRLDQILNALGNQAKKGQVLLAPDSKGEVVKKLSQELKPQQVLVLENLRFHEAEEHPEKNPDFAKQLASLADIYVNDAFGTCHRKHSSTYSIVQYFKDKALIGFLIEKEIEYLDKCIKNPQKPFYALIGGAKLSSKIKVLTGLLDKVDELFIGGGMAYPFFKQQGHKIGASLFEEGSDKTAQAILLKAKAKNVAVNLPVDIVIADEFKNEAHTQTILSSEDIPDNYMGMDIGPETCTVWQEKIVKAKTIFWNGPMGVFEMSNFKNGTQKIAAAIAASKAVSVIGGGDSAAAVENLGLQDKFSHLSTGGGASLEYLENGSLPCLDILKKNKV